VVDHVVDHRGGDGLVAEHAAPAAEGRVADLVGDDQPVASRLAELVREPSGRVGGGEAGDPLGCGRELDAVTVVRRGDAQPGSAA
jgi:hypothetical protein